MDLGLTGQPALVAAASKGMGRAVAEGLAREGARLAIFARTEADVRLAADEIRGATGAEVLALAGDATRAADVQRVVGEAAARFGGLRVLVTNAGGPPLGPFDEMDDAKWQAAFELNLLSVIRLIRAAVPHLRAAGGGRIVNIQSTAVKQPIDGLVLSNTLRVGVVGLAKTLASELARDRITVNTVCPGRIYTERLHSLFVYRARAQGGTVEQARAAEEALIPLGRLGTPEEFAAMVVFLCSEPARYVTGVTVQVDGGLVRGLL
ncbi:MAG TPA: SDR family oxidoreductase [Candidatus Methylomirabilis sp.]|jgi:3-oxoacyl-[acyl-carrier protein] reductase